jgi:hypothetical protein
MPPGSTSSSKRSLGTSVPSPSNSTASASIASKRRKGKQKQSPDKVLSQADDESSITHDKEIDKPASTTRPMTELFVLGTNPNQMVGDKVAVCSLVVKRLFPHVKFVCDPLIELAYSDDAKSICGVVRAECAPPANVSVTKWWENARRWIGRQITILRSSKTTQLKWSFMGK